ncbi:homolog to 6-phosphogluconate dehydrogenase (plasmid) [Natrialba magadii ATCC 43099]|uniref:6-phosphogluconate dehydrogenase n=1 Tax=Natrialba magadii (strain ATCC 43099 / DSM 3394 / CCM 3739 / CIP 104546 / IAM 13178 / JCM 8861 / NBRC 102185 / NCIMB 2190 / MS3) TaxID=547559 RepID=D3T1Z6_NATMM|nr:NAD(P)-binding domain-containing protein [Natrialba magadii]ADD07605.1 homolog to 6-phosphogluconate dehydrogenase [Natrialba magadii ATCC 43099]ELY27080.1 6-phosphogluconate dehydrogenase [Natrialba magadii ATCC 43099]
MSDISVIGCGAMGSALIETLAKRNTRVSIWNRTRERALALAGPHVTVVDSVEEAIDRSPLTIVCVAGYDVTKSLIEEASVSLDGKTIGSTSFVTHDQGRQLDELIRSDGGRYLDVEILGYPSDIGMESTPLYLSGDRAAFKEARPLLTDLGTVKYVSSTPGDAYISGLAVLLPYLPMAVSIFQGAKVCERNDIPLEWYTQEIRTVYPQHIDRLCETVEIDPDPADPGNIEASVRTWGDGAKEYADYLESADLDAGIYQALHRLFIAGIEAGRGDHDWSCIGDIAADHPTT